MAELNPICLILVTTGPKQADKLLFRYPFEPQENSTTHTSNGSKPSLYGVSASQVQNSHKRNRTTVHNSTLFRFSDKILAHLLTVNSKFCDRKFDIKIEDIRFLGFPKPLKSDQISAFNVVFVVRSSVSESVVSCYHNLSQQLTVAIKHEEQRCDYLSMESRIMVGVQDEVAALPEDCMESPFRKMLPQSSLAQTLKTVYDNLVNKGVVQLHINKWIQINFCLPHKIYIQLAPKGYSIEPEAVTKCLSAIRPYHSVLLLVEETDLLDCLPLDCTPTLPKLMRVVSPLKSLQSLALDADISLTQVFRLVTHLVYWGKALIIYPLCKSNVYVITPHANTYVHSHLATSFTDLFPGPKLLHVLSEFSLPTSLGQERDVLRHPQQQKQKVQMVIWMLQHQLLTQLHTYVYLMPGKHHTTDSSTAVDGSPIKAPMTPNLDDFQLQLTPSVSDVTSANSDGTSRQPSIEGGSDITEEMRNDWRQAEWVLGRFTQSHRDTVLRLVASFGLDDFKLFIRLCPYFNGKHHIEEIMYYENVRRSCLVTLLEKLRDVIVTCVHHDPATTFYMK